jgi:ATP-dependent DNA ligase
MGWYANHKARRAAATAGLVTPLKTGLGDTTPAGLAEKVERAREREDRMKARAIAEDKHDGVRGAKKARKRERKLARRGTAGPS